MGRKIFVSYKYSDNLVRSLDGRYPATVRDYVDVLQNKIDKSDHIFKGEDDGEDLSSLADSTIASKLGDKIFDSTVTIVFVSKGMRETRKSDKEQWIPWEISYSLKEQSRDYGRSKTNAVLAVVLPDRCNNYEYFITNNGCHTILKTDQLFNILKENMFNKKNPNYHSCSCGASVHIGNTESYILSIKWDHFIEDINKYVQQAIDIRQDINKYNIKKTV